MRTDSPSLIIGHLGNIEDDMASIELEWSEAAGREAEWAEWHREVFLQTRQVLAQEGLLTKDHMGLTTKDVTETAVKDFVEAKLRETFKREYAQHKKDAGTLAMFERRFKSLDTRRSIGQTALKVHLRADEQFGQGARGQSGQGQE